MTMVFMTSPPLASRESVTGTRLPQWRARRRVDAARDPALPSPALPPKREPHAAAPSVRNPRFPLLLDRPPGLDDRPDGDGDRDRLAGLRHRPPNDGSAS